LYVLDLSEVLVKKDNSESYWSASYREFAVCGWNRFHVEEPRDLCSSPDVKMIKLNRVRYELYVASIDTRMRRLFGWKMLREETTWKNKAEMGGCC
jgi:hypothetical protein